MAYSDEVLADGPLAYYRLGETSGAIVTDSSGNGRNGAYSGTVTQGVTGALAADADTALGLGGSGYALVNHASWMNVSTVTVEIWFRTTQTGAQSLIARYGSSSVSEVIALDLSTSNVVRAYGNFSGVKIASATVTGLRDGNWHHAVGTYDGSAIRLYIDGTQVASVAATGTPQSGSLGYRFGSRNASPNNNLIGAIDEAAIYGTALSDARIATHYTAGATVPPTAAGSGTASLTLSASGAAVAAVQAASGAASLSFTASGASAGAGDIGASGSASFEFDAIAVLDEDAEPPEQLGYGIPLSMDMTPRVIPPLDPTVNIQPTPITAIATDVPAFTEGGDVTEAFKRSGVEVRGVWGSRRLFMGGQDVTVVRGKPTIIHGYQLTEPHGYGPADFTFPAFTELEAAPAWMMEHTSAELVHVDPDGNRVRTIWRGLNTRPQPSRGGMRIHCDGEASGRLALRDRQSSLVFYVKDVGHRAPKAYKTVGLRYSPFPRGFTTDCKVPTRGLDGGTYLDYVDALIAQGQTLDGKQLTVLPTGQHGDLYEFGWKDRATVHATLFAGARGVGTDDLSTDLQEKPNALFAYFRTPQGELVRNAKYPGLIQAPPPAFPGDMQLGDTGDVIDILQQKLYGMRYMNSFDVNVSETFDANTLAGVRRLQRDARLPVTGVVNLKTWNALFDVTTTGPSLWDAHISPFIKDPRLGEMVETSNGSDAYVNPEYDPNVVQVDKTMDLGVQDRKAAVEYLEAHYEAIHNGATPWTGTIDLGSDLFAGSVTHEEAPNVTPMSRFDLRAGQNILLRNFQGGSILLHVSGVDVAEDGSVKLAVDTHARDLMTIAEIIKRNQESRVSPHRAWKQSRRKGNGHSSLVEADEHFGHLNMRVVCPGGKWTVFPVVIGQSGSINRIRIVTTPGRQFCVGLTVGKTDRRWWNRVVGNPFAGKRWERERVKDMIERRRILLGAWGESGDPVKIKLLDDGGMDYHTPFGENGGLAWVAIYPRGHTVIRPQRILWPVLESGA